MKEFKEKTADELKELSAEDLAGYYNEYNTNQRAEIEAKIEAKASDEELKSKPVDLAVQASAPEQKVIKPMPPEISTIPLESLCQDLQSDLTKYKRIVENLKKEKN